MIQTPELEKMSKVQDKSQAIGNFLEWLSYRDPELILCEVDNNTDSYFPSNPNIEKLLAEYFEIDLNKAEEERRAILDNIRNEKITMVNTVKPESIIQTAEKIMDATIVALNRELTDIEIEPLVSASESKTIANIKDYKEMKRKLKKKVKNGN